MTQTPQSLVRLELATGAAALVGLALMVWGWRNL